MYSLYIDESGKHDLRSIVKWSPHFSLAGIIIHKSCKEPLKIKADRIKFKYWGRTDIVFHANEIRQETEDFGIFQLPGTKLNLDDFCNDFKSNFLNENYRVGLVSINKDTFLKNNPPIAYALSQLSASKPGSGWHKQVKGAGNNLLKEAATELFTMYLDFLVKKNYHGDVIMESSDEVQDMIIYSAYAKMLTSGFAPFGMTSTDVRKHFTGISFVTKLNHDTETQLADISAHYLNLELRKLDSLMTSYPKKHDEDVIKILNSKSFKYKRKTGDIQQSSFYRMA